jgi:hypothetical protein
MINYNRSAFGLKLLLRIHGSAIYRSFFVASFAVGFFLLLRIHFHDNEMGEQLGHPYAIGVVISGTTFLIVFRASQGYSRYWEATTSVYTMLGKWMDACTHAAIYHLQCDHYDKIKPPSFYNHPELNARFMTRDRERLRNRSGFASDEGRQSEESSSTQRIPLDTTRVVSRSINVVKDPQIGIKKRKRNLLEELKLVDLFRNYLERI